MKARAVTVAEREAQIVALWNGHPRHRRTAEDVVSFYNWLVDYAPWLVPRSAQSIDRVRELVAPHITSAEETGARGTRSPRQRQPGRDKRSRGR